MYWQVEQRQHSVHRHSLCNTLVATAAVTDKNISAQLTVSAVLGHFLVKKSSQE